MQLKQILFTITVSVYVINAHAQNDTLTDSRDGKFYPVVEIGDLIWMRQNLDYNMPNSTCYEDELVTCGFWGRLYAKEDAKKACPTGWRLPNVKDWQVLSNVDIYSLMDTLNWKNNEKHTNETGLSLQPSGIMHKKKFWNQYLQSSLWFEDREDPESNWHLHVHGDNNPDTTHVFHTHEHHIKVRKFAVRCVRESNPSAY